MENYDAERHEEFKRYEMLKEHERREYLKGLDQEKREQEEKRLQELKEKHRQHPKVNAPVGPCPGASTKQSSGGEALMVSVFLQGSVDQLREVWEATDGLDPQEFNPKTFFKLHGKVVLVPPGVSWFFPVPLGCSWCFLVSSGSSWCLLISPGASCFRPGTDALFFLPHRHQ